MKAKEMFEKLGYEWQETNCYIQYTKFNWKHFIFRSKTTIYFWKLMKKISVYDETSLDIDLDLIQAINKQIEELGWNRDE